jgi:hypothetical protein
MYIGKTDKDKVENIGMDGGIFSTKAQAEKTLMSYLHDGVYDADEYAYTIVEVSKPVWQVYESPEVSYTAKSFTPKTAKPKTTKGKGTKLKAVS